MSISIDDLILCKVSARKRTRQPVAKRHGSLLHGAAPPSVMYPLLAGIMDDNYVAAYAPSHQLFHKISRLNELTREASAFLSLPEEVLSQVKRRRMESDEAGAPVEPSIPEPGPAELDDVASRIGRASEAYDMGSTESVGEQQLMIQNQPVIAEGLDFEALDGGSTEIEGSSVVGAGGGDSSSTGGDFGEMDVLLGGEESSEQGINPSVVGRMPVEAEEVEDLADNTVNLEEADGDEMHVNLDDLLADDAAQMDDRGWDLDSIDLGFYPNEFAQPTDGPDTRFNSELDWGDGDRGVQLEVISADPLDAAIMELDNQMRMSQQAADEEEAPREAAVEELDASLSLVKPPAPAETLTMESSNEISKPHASKLLWGVAKDSVEETMDELYAARLAAQEALSVQLKTQMSPRLLRLTGIHPSFQDLNDTSELGALKIKAPQAVSNKLPDIQQSVRDFNQTTRSISILRYLVSESSAEDSYERHIDIYKVIDPRNPLLRTFTADLTTHHPNMFKDVKKKRFVSSFLSEMPRLVKALAKKETRQAAVAYNEALTDAESANRRGRRPKGMERRTPPLPTSATMLRQATEDRIRSYALFRAWQGSLVDPEPKSHLGIFDAIEPPTDPIVVKWISQAAHVVDPLRYHLSLGTLHRDAVVDIALQWQSCSSDLHYQDSDAYRPIGRPTDRDSNAVTYELIHAPIAWTFFGINARPSMIQFARYHRPDFRTGIFAAHYFVAYRSSYALGTSTNTLAYNNRKQAASLLNRKFDLSGGRAYGSSLVDGPSLGSSAIGTGNTKTPAMPIKGGQPLFSPWRVHVPATSKVLELFKTRAGYTGSAVGSDVATDHPSDLFVSSGSLSLAEWVPITLFEHSTPPILVANPGMVARVTRYYRPSRESVSALSQAEKKLRGRLGFFGPLQLLGDTVLTLFGSPFRVKPNQGVAFFKSTLIKGPCFTHPFDPRRPLPTPDAWKTHFESCHEPRHPRQGWSTLNHYTDYRLTDFLLVRTHAINGVNNAPVRVCLRPLFYGFGESTLQLKSPVFAQGIRGPAEPYYGLATSDIVEALESIARVGMYTLGQCELLAEIPAPDGKKVGDIRKEWLKAYSLRLAANGVVDFAQNKQKCFMRFGGVFDQSTINRFLLVLKKSGVGTGPSATALASSLGGSSIAHSSGVLIKPVAENAIQKLVTPEQICGLEACLLGNAQLNWHGLRYLKSVDGVSVVRAVLQFRDIASDILWARARGAWKASHQYMGSSTTAQIPKLLQLPPPFRGQLPHFTTNLSGIARFIEELLIQTPWTQQKGFSDVTSKKNTQFLLGSVFDPSLGRYENLCFLKEDIATTCLRDPLLVSQYRIFRAIQKNKVFMARPVALNDESVPVFEEAKRDKVEELSMAQLQLGLLRAGIKHASVYRKTRSELVNLFYRLQFMLVPKDSLLSLGNQASRLDHSDYVCRVNDLQLRQRSTLQLDDIKPEVKENDTTDLYEDATQPSMDEAALEASFLDSLADEDGASESSPASALNRPTTPSTGGSPQQREETNYAVVKKTLDDLVWNETDVFGKSHTFGHSGAMYEFESQEIDRKRDALTREQRASVYPLSSPALNNIAHKWMSHLHDRDVKEFLKQKQGQFMPRLKWTKTRAPGPNQTGPTEKVIYIYGEQNIEKFLAWRRRKLMAQNKQQQHQHKSNPSSQRGSHSSVLTGSLAANLEGGGALLQSGATLAQRMSQGSRSVTGTKKGKGGMAAIKSQDTSDMEAESTLQAASEVRSGLPITAARLTARQQRLLYERHKEAEKAGNAFESCLVKYVGSPDGALEELNQNLQRIVLTLKKFNWFWDEVKESDAPNYYQVVKQPMWLAKVFEKTKEKQVSFLYLSSAHTDCRSIQRSLLLSMTSI
eukprot:Blabericola_migrator_1__9425@NODE_50_length_16319_cov_92_020182_g46_i0_p2_GENE_NODE_50_length_16319_cov_92_020182_g46_i0NODE_50_length_16319_cov_92_020182_g46_i0_p2_ORF_typecomplete_len1874_score306_27DUF3591/PF12157_8/6_7e34Bromodomain/PF00439_25/1_4e05SHD1/PF03983_12/0_29_NODE_50_length_16319_cov_92_020182_g46_i0585679